jgi:hypothetical protein
MDNHFLRESGKTRVVFKFLVVLCVLAYLVLLTALFKTFLTGRKGPEPLVIESAVLQGTGERQSLLKVVGSGFDEQVRASLSYDTGNHRAIIGSLKTWSRLHQVVVRGDLAFLANQDRGLQVVDVRKPQNPRIIGSVDTPGRAWALCLQGDYAYVADGSNGLQVISIANPKKPRLLGSVATRGDAIAVDALDRFILVVDKRGIAAIAVESPDKPAILHTFDLPSRVWHLAVRNRRVFLANGRNGIAILRFDGRSGFHYEQTLKTRGDARYICFSDNRLLVGCGTRGLEVFALRGKKFELQARTDTPGFARGVAAAGKRIFIADHRCGLQILEWNPEGDLKFLGTVDTPSFAWDVVSAKGVIFVADQKGGLQVIDDSRLSDFSLPTLETDGYAWGSASSRNCLYLADGKAGVKIIGIGPSGKMRVAVAIDTPGIARRLVFSENRLFVADLAGGLVIIGRDGGRWQIETAVQFPENAVSVSVLNSLACVAVGKAGLVVLDVADPRRPRILSRLASLGHVKDVALVGDQAFVAAGPQGLLRVSLKDPTRPELIGKVELPRHLQLFCNATFLSVSGDKLLMAGSRAGCQIFDIADPNRPRYLSTLAAMGNITWVKGSGDYGFICDNEGSLLVADLKNPRQPCVIGSLGTPRGKSIEVVNNEAFVTLGGGGVKRMPLPVEVRPEAVTDSRKLALRIPPLTTPGNYLLTLYREREHVMMADAISVRGE